MIKEICTGHDVNAQTLRMNCVITTYPLFTNYFRFLQMIAACDIIIRFFPLNIVYNAFPSLHQRKKTEMSFLRVSALLLVSVVLNHDADSSFYIIKMIFSLNMNEKLPLEKCVCLLWNILTAWFPALKLKMTSSFVSVHGSHYAQILLKGVDIKSATSVLSCLRPFGTPSGRAYAQYRLCSRFMIMKHICDDISYHEWKTTSISL